MKIVDRPSPLTVATGDAAKIRKAQTSPKTQGSSTVTRLSHEGVSSAPDINISRINELKQAIAEGRFTIDADKISQALVYSALELMD